MLEMCDQPISLSRPSGDDMQPIRLPRVLVSHPGRQHSHQLAMALADAGMLAGYLTGVPAHRDAVAPWLRPFLNSYLNSYQIPLDGKLVRHNFVSSIVRRVAGRLQSRQRAIAWAQVGDGWFDRWAARQVSQTRPDVLVCYESSALRTFRAAKQLGIKTVLDAASFHHRWQDNFYDPVESPSVHQQIITRKDAEIALADKILTVSEFARESYVDGGASPERVLACPLGADSQAFSDSERLSFTRSNRPLRFVFVGHIDRRKGAEILVDAASRLNRSGTEFSLTMIGKRTSELRCDDLTVVNHLDWMSQKELALELARHHVLVLPSRHDSFGMVVAEAMACGLPVIVSDHVGAKEMVAEHKNGLVVPAGNSDALAKAMQWFIDNRSQLPEMSRAARQVAERYDWQHYRQRIVDFFHSFPAVC